MKNEIRLIQAYQFILMYAKNTLVLRMAILTMIIVLDYPCNVNSCDISESVTSLKTAINTHAS